MKTIALSGLVIAWAPFSTQYDSVASPRTRTLQINNFVCYQDFISFVQSPLLPNRRFWVRGGMGWLSLPFFVHNLKYNLHLRDNNSLFHNFFSVPFDFYLLHSFFFCFFFPFVSLFFKVCNITHSKMNSGLYAKWETFLSMSK